MEADSDVALSALQHVVFCPRQAALIHVEQIWREDAATTEGALLHDRVDVPGFKTRPGVRVVRAMPLTSRRLGVRGRADMVELRADPATPRGLRPYPVEMKRGRMKHQLADQVQLCAQAFCLEEMFEVSIEEGALFYGKSHRRLAIAFDPVLRAETIQAAELMHRLVREAETPPPKYELAKCSACSLENICLPRHSGRQDALVRSMALLREDGNGR